MMILGFVFLTIVITASDGLLGDTHNPTVDQKLDDLSREMLELRTKVESLEVLLLQNNDPPIAFLAGLSETITVGQHQHIIFDNVITNVGNAYKVSDGHFVAPVRGVYIFFVTLTTIPGHSASVILKKNGQWIGHALADDVTGGPHISSTLVSTAQLEVGDEVWVQNEYAYSNSEMIDGHNWSYFVGHLISGN